MKRITIILWCWVMWLSSAMSQQLLVNVPSHVTAGETFRLEYTVTTVNVSGNLSIGNIPDALELVYGPSISRQESYSVRNGHASGSSSITFTYMLIGNKNGTYTIPAAHIAVGGKTLTSNPVKVTVVGAGNAQQQPNNSGGVKFHQDNEDQPRMRQAGSAITERDLFIKTSANKTHVHEQEPILLTYKVYTLVELTNLDVIMPDLTGFHSQEVPLPQQKSFHIENVNGRNYRCVTWRQYVMYPQMTGKLEIPSITFHGIVVQENRNVDPYEAFLNGGSGTVDVKCEIKAPGLSIQVDPLPERPANFSGGVGHFNISAQMDKSEVKAGNPVNFRIVVGGIGNLKLIKQPEINLPKDFDKYDPKVTDKTRLTANGVEGNMVYDVLTVPRNQGKYTIPPIEFTYYDTGTNNYKTIKTQSFTINVEKGDGSGAVSDYSDTKNKDIRPLKTGKTALHSRNEFFFESTWYWIWLLIPLVLFVVLLVVFRKRAIDNANIGKMRGKKANKVATKRLRAANKLMLAGRQEAFYDEVLRALWGYVGDKLNMPVEQLSRENISEKLSGRNVDKPTIDKFIGALDDCEYARYAPGDAKGNMNKTFESAMTAIMKIENAMKSSKRQTATAHLLLLVVVGIMSAIPSHAITKANADAEYAKGNYAQAIKDYEELLKQGVSPELYYNLGNAYYRSENITRAVLNYERALMLSPGDEDIRFNLQLASSKTIDKITPESEMFFVTWYHSLVNLMSVDRWAKTAILSIILALVLCLFYLFAERVWLQKVGFFGAILFVVLFVSANIFAYQQKKLFEERTTAIVISPSASVKKTPTGDGAESFVLHEGTKVSITDSTINEWFGVRLADGREGWIQAKQIEEI